MTSPFTTGQLIDDRYVVVKRLGAGAFGAVYLVEDQTLGGKRLALKVLKLGLDAEREQKLIKRFRQEAQRALDLVHPSVVIMRHYFERDGLYAYAMDYVEGKTLDDLRKDQPDGRLSVERALRRTREVLEALEAAHEIGIVHRDIKPENVLVAFVGTERERSRVLDFGIAKDVLSSGTLSEAGAIVGTPAYMSPEQGAGKPVDARADLYAVGTMLYELIAGRLPYISENSQGYIFQREFDPVPPFSETAPGLALPPGLEALVRKAMERRPEDRFASARAMIEAIDQVLAPPPRAMAATEGARPAAPGALLGTTREMVHGRIDLAPTPTDAAAAAGIRTLFLRSGPLLRLGRSRPGQQPGKPDNTLVMRLLPCRSEALDPDHFRRTKQISGCHCVIERRGRDLVLTDGSAYGTWVDGHRLPSGQPTVLPDAFSLGLAEVLALEGHVLRQRGGPGGAGGSPEGLLLSRVGNLPEHAYLWVLGAVGIGEPGPCSVPLGTGLQGRVEAVDGGLRVALGPGASLRPADVGEETRADGLETASAG